MIADMKSNKKISLYIDYNKEPYSFLVNDATLPSHDPLRFRKNLL